MAASGLERARPCTLGSSGVWHAPRSKRHRRQSHPEDPELTSKRKVLGWVQGERRSRLWAEEYLKRLRRL